MANVNAYGQIVSTRGSVIPLLNTAQTEGTEEEILTDSNYVGSAQSVGTFGDQEVGGFVAAQGGVIFENDMTYNFVKSAGIIKMAFPMGSGVSGGSQGLPAAVPYPKRLASGDQLIGMANAANDREASLTVACSNGEYHVFAVTAAGAGEHEFVSVLTGNGIGTTLQGRVITHWYALAGGNDAEKTSSVMLLDGSGIPTASLGFCASTASEAASYQNCRAAVMLNSRAVFRTDG